MPDVLGVQIRYSYTNNVKERALRIEIERVDKRTRSTINAFYSRDVEYITETVKKAIIDMLAPRPAAGHYEEFID